MHLDLKNNNSVSIVPVSYALFLYSQHPCSTKPFVYIKIKKTFINTLPFKTKTLSHTLSSKR